MTLKSRQAVLLLLQYFLTVTQNISAICSAPLYEAVFDRCPLQFSVSPPTQPPAQVTARSKMAAGTGTKITSADMLPQSHWRSTKRTHLLKCHKLWLPCSFLLLQQLWTEQWPLGLLSFVKNWGIKHRYSLKLNTASPCWRMTYIRIMPPCSNTLKYTLPYRKSILYCIQNSQTSRILSGRIPCGYLHCTHSWGPGAICPMCVKMST